MRLHAFRSTTVLALIACAVAAAIFGLAGSSSAGGAATCTTSSTPPTTPGGPGSPSSCVIETLAPSTLTINTAGLSITRFNDQGSNSATHLSISTTFNSTVAIQSIKLIVNGSQVISPSCTTTSPPTVVSCTEAGTVKGGNFAELIVRYVAPSSPTTLTAFGTVTYAEGGLKGNPVNGTQWSNVDSVDVVTSDVNDSGKPQAAGKCTTLGTNGSDSIGSVGDATLATSVVYPAAKNQSLLSCTPAAAGVIQNPVVPNPSPIVTEVAFVEVPELVGKGSAQGFAVVKLDFTPLPPGVTLNGQNKLILREDTHYAEPFFSNFITVPEGCNASTGLPPNPGIPEVDSTDTSTPPHHNDTCIADRVSLPKGGGELVLHVIGNPLDGKYGS